MRIVLALFAFVASGAASVAQAPSGDGPVTGGSAFGMGGADYFGDTRARMPFTPEAAPLLVGVSDLERARAARRVQAVSRAGRPAVRRTVARAGEGR